MPALVNGMRPPDRRERGRLPFHRVNRRGSPGFDPGLQRHHLLPRQLLGMECFATLFQRIRPATLGFHDFRANGLLLPSREESAMRLALPLHRGPHRQYNAMVIERFGQIEAGFATIAAAHPRVAECEARFRINLLQRGLRHRLIKARNKAYRLNSRDPLGQGSTLASSTRWPSNYGQPVSRISSRAGHLWRIDIRLPAGPPGRPRFRWP